MSVPCLKRVMYSSSDAQGGKKFFTHILCEEVSGAPFNDVSAWAPGKFPAAQPGSHPKDLHASGGMPCISWQLQHQ